MPWSLVQRKCPRLWIGKIGPLVILFGDGAGAAIVDSRSGPSLLGFRCGADGSNPSLLHQPAGGSLKPASVQTIDRRHFLR